MPAKAKLQETKQFGGYNACSFCEIRGEQIVIKSNSKNKKPAKEVKKIVYPEREHSYPLRDEEDTLKKMLAASSTKDDVDGIKGKTIDSFKCSKVTGGQFD